MGILSGLFGSDITIDKLNTDELHKEKIRLEVTEQSLDRELQVLESQQRKLFDSAAKSPSSAVQDRRAARQITQIKSLANDKERRALDVSQKIMALDRLTRAKDRKNELQEKGLWKDIGTMSPDSLADMLTEHRIEDEQQLQKISQINNILGVEDSLISMADTPEMTEIMDALATARESGDVDGEFERHITDSRTQEGLL